MELADAVPLRGVAAEIILRRGGAGRAHRGEPLAVAGDHRIFRIEPRDQRAGDIDAALFAEPVEGPGALAEALDQPRLGQEPQVAGQPRLRLAQDFGEVGDGQFGLGQQRQDAQPRGFAGGLQRRRQPGKGELFLIHRHFHLPAAFGYRYKDIFISLNGWTQAQWDESHRMGAAATPIRAVKPRSLAGTGGCGKQMPICSFMAETTKRRRKRQHLRTARRRNRRRTAGTAGRVGLFHRPHPHAVASPRRIAQRMRASRMRSALSSSIRAGRGAFRASKPRRMCCCSIGWIRRGAISSLQWPRHYSEHRGTFALRSPARPNPIAVSVARLVRIDGNTLSVVGIDCLDGTPLLDIKPYFASTDSVPDRHRLAGTRSGAGFPLARIDCS